MRYINIKTYRIQKAVCVILSVCAACLLFYVLCDCEEIRAQRVIDKTQEKLAKKLNTNQASYAHYENATNMIPTVFLYNLTTVYKPFSIDKLLGRKKQ